MSIKSSALDAESTESAAAGCELSSGKRITKQETIRKQEWVTDWLKTVCVKESSDWPEQKNRGNWSNLNYQSNGAFKLDF